MRSFCGAVVFTAAAATIAGHYGNDDDAVLVFVHSFADRTKHHPIRFRTRRTATKSSSSMLMINDDTGMVPMMMRSSIGSTKEAIENDTRHSYHDFSFRNTSKNADDDSDTYTTTTTTTNNNNNNNNQCECEDQLAASGSGILGLDSSSSRRLFLTHTSTSSMLLWSSHVTNAYATSIASSALLSSYNETTTQSSTTAPGIDTDTNVFEYDYYDGIDDGGNDNDDDDIDSDRRRRRGGGIVTIPLTYTGRELLISYRVDDSIFRAVVDTGSPFLMIPGSCGRNTQIKSGCYQNQGVPVVGLNPTIEIFDGFQGDVYWRKAYFDWTTTTTMTTTATMTAKTQKSKITDRQSYHQSKNKKKVIFGVASESILSGPGGVFFGMIKNTDKRIRPSFLSQTDVEAFRVNLKTRPRTLALSNRPLLSSINTNASNTIRDDGSGDVSDYVPMTNLLRQKYGDPVGHYTACAKSLYVNGYPLVDEDATVLVIFDTGVTGMIVDRNLYDGQYYLARRRKEKSLFGNVEINFDTVQGNQITLQAIKPITTPFDPADTWKKFPKNDNNNYIIMDNASDNTTRQKTNKRKRNAVYLIVMGLAFLEDRILTVDIDKERLWVE